MAASFSSYSPAGGWLFTVKLTDEGGTVMEMVADRTNYPEGPEIRLYPEAISDEEAVKAARIAAKLMTAAEEFYLNLHSSGQEPGSEVVWTMGRFVPDVSDVPEEVVHFVRRAAAERYNQYETFVNTDENAKDLGIEFDDFRITALEGPWTGTAYGMDLEAWQFDYEFHTTTPEAVMELVNGGADLTEDGWLRPTYPYINYAAFLVNDAGTRAFLLNTEMFDASPGPTLSSRQSASWRPARAWWTPPASPTWT